MTVFKYIKDNKLYVIKVNNNGSMIAIPYGHGGNPIINCNRKDFFLEKVLNIKRDSGFL